MLDILQILRCALKARVQDDALVVFRLAQDPRPGRKKSRGIVHGLMHILHVAFCFAEARCDAFYHAIDLAHFFQLGAKLGIAGFFDVVL